MSQLVMFDAAYPPGPDQLVQDLDQVGAQACAVYVYGEAAGNWTVAHVQRLRSARKLVLPIVVPGNAPPAPAVTYAAARAKGIIGGPIVVDLERFSFPSAAWVLVWERWGPPTWRPERYGTTAGLGPYPPATADWIASWLRTGVMNPEPLLPPGRVAWQFVNDVVINGHQYDVSVVDPAFLGGTPMSDQEIQADVKEELDKGTAFGETSWAQTNVDEVKGIQAEYNLGQQILATLQGLKVNSIGLTPAQLAGALRAAADNLAPVVAIVGEPGALTAVNPAPVPDVRLEPVAGAAPDPEPQPEPTPEPAPEPTPAPAPEPTPAPAPASAPEATSPAIAGSQGQPCTIDHAPGDVCYLSHPWGSGSRPPG
jgi:hypothetical protein